MAWHELVDCCFKQADSFLNPCRLFFEPCQQFHRGEFALALVNNLFRVENRLSRLEGILAGLGCRCQPTHGFTKRGEVKQRRIDKDLLQFWKEVHKAHEFFGRFQA